LDAERCALLAQRRTISIALASGTVKYIDTHGPSSRYKFRNNHSLPTFGKSTREGKVTVVPGLRLPEPIGEIAAGVADAKLKQRNRWPRRSDA
jgi:hypothetical protein